MAVYNPNGLKQTTDFLTEVSRGNLPGIDGYIRYGERANIPTANFGEVNTFGDLTRLTSNTNIEVLSGSSEDVAGGNGAARVALVLVDSDYDRRTVLVDLNGTSVVTTDINGETLNAFRVIRAFVTGDVGSSATNVGAITIRVAGGGSTQNVIPAGEGQTEATFWIIRKGYVANYVGGVLTAVKPSGTDTIVRFRAEVRIPNPNGGYQGWRVAFKASINTAAESNVSIEQLVSNALPEGTEIRFEAQAGNSGSEVLVRLFIVESRVNPLPE